MDLVNVIESAYADAPTQDDWLDGVLTASLPLLDRGFGVVGYTFDASDPHAVATSDHRHRGPRPGVCEAMMHAESMLARAPDDPRGTITTRPVSTMSMHVGGTRVAALCDAVDALRGARDMICVVATDPTGRGMGIGALLPKETTPTRAEVRRWSRVAAHLAAGFRLRRATARGDGDAVLEPAGKVAHAEGDAKAAAAREALARAAIAVDRARGRLRRQDADEAVEVWRGLVAGRWSLVERFESDGRRFLIARPNDPKVDALPMLTERERQVLIYRAFGHPLKLIAYELGLSVPVVSRTLARAMTKIGVKSPADLMALLALPRPA